MTLSLPLTRSGPAPFAPAPRGVRAGDFIFSSSIYPIDDNGHAIQVDELLGEACPSLIEAQTRHCLESLKAVLAEFGSTLTGEKERRSSRRGCSDSHSLQNLCGGRRARGSSDCYCCG
jgi:hypothetical protein